MTDFKITEAGEYRTRRGGKAVVLCKNAPNNDAPIIGYVTGCNDKDCAAFQWGINGMLLHGDNNDPDDIIAKWKEPEVKEYWYGVFPSGDFYTTFFDTLETAKRRLSIYEDDIIGYVKTRLKINPDGTRHMEIIKQEWK